LRTSERPLQQQALDQAYIGQWSSRTVRPLAFGTATIRLRIVAVPRDIQLTEVAGHWIQQEQPVELARRLVGLASELDEAVRS
jgi:hypothetical protein